MTKKQEYMIIDTHANSKVFFFAHSLKSAKDHMLDYVKRNTGKFPMAMYRASTKPKPFPRWEYMGKVECNKGEKK